MIGLFGGERLTFTKESIMTFTPAIVHLENGQPLTTSSLIAQHFNKAHKNILRDIDKLECSDEFRELNF